MGFNCTDKKNKIQPHSEPALLFSNIPLRYYYKSKSGLFWIFRLWCWKIGLIFFTNSCRCSHHISIRITNSEFSRIFTKTESFGKTDQTKIHNSFLIKRCGDQHLQKICNPALPLFVYLWIPPQTIYSFRGYSLLLFLSIFIGNLLCCWNPLYDNYAWFFLVVCTHFNDACILY